MSKVSVVLLLAAVCTAPNAEASEATAPSVFRMEDVSIVFDGTFFGHGSPPRYSIEVHGDGGLRYEGKENVRVLGVVRSTIEPALVQELLEALLEARFLTLEESYTSSHTLHLDEAGQASILMKTQRGIAAGAVTLRIGSFEKTVTFVPQYAPCDLVALFKHAQDVLDTRQWTRAKPD